MSISTGPALDPLDRFAGCLAAAQNRAHPSDELLGAEWLGHVVVGPELEADQLVRLLGPRGEHHDRHGRVPPQLSCHVETVATGQAEVEHDQIGSLGPCQAQRVVAVGGAEHDETGVLEVVARQTHYVGRVVDD